MLISIEQRELTHQGHDPIFYKLMHMRLDQCLLELRKVHRSEVRKLDDIAEVQASIIKRFFKLLHPISGRSSNVRLNVPRQPAGTDRIVDTVADHATEGV